MKLKGKESCDVLTPKDRRLHTDCSLTTKMHHKISLLGFFQCHILTEQDAEIPCQILFTKWFVLLTWLKKRRGSHYLSMLEGGQQENDMQGEL